MLLKRTLMVVSSVVLTLALALPAAAQENVQIEALLADLDRTESHFTIGLGMVFLGSMERDAALGYPKSVWGMSPLLGITWRNYDGHPSRAEIERAAEIAARDYGDLGESDFRKRVKAEVADNSFTYFGVATTALILPGIDAGFSWDFADHTGSGGNVEVGITWGLNTVLIPFPYLGASYTF